MPGMVTIVSIVAIVTIVFNSIKAILANEATIALLKTPLQPTEN